MLNKILFSVISSPFHSQYLNITINNLKKIYFDNANIVTFSRVSKKMTQEVKDQIDFVIKRDGDNREHNRKDQVPDLEYYLYASAKYARENNYDWVVAIHADYIPINNKIYYLIENFNNYDVITQQDKRYTNGLQAGYMAFKNKLFANENDFKVGNGVWESKLGEYLARYRVVIDDTRFGFLRTPFAFENKTELMDKFGIHPIGFMHTHNIQLANLWRL